jgi:hypothetical protein
MAHKDGRSEDEIGDGRTLVAVALMSQARVDQAIATRLADRHPHGRLVSDMDMNAPLRELWRLDPESRGVPFRDQSVPYFKIRRRPDGRPYGYTKAQRAWKKANDEDW